MGDLFRLQIDIEPDAWKEMEELQQLGRLRTKKELFNNAMTLLKWASRERQRGNVILSYNEQDDSSRELQMPFLEAVAANRPVPVGAVIDEVPAG